MNERTSPASQWISGDSEINAINIHFLRTGHHRSAVIALHGLMGNGACWTPVARALEHEYDVVMPDARGHGLSSAPAEGYLYDDHANDVLGLIEALELSRPVLLGHSMGGMTAAVVASRLGASLRAVVLADPTFISPEWQREVYESDVAEQHRQALGTGKSELVAQAQLRHPHRSVELINLIAEARLQTQMQAFEVLTPPNPDFRELIRDICVPILLVLGSKGVVSPETAQGLQAINPLLSYTLIPDVGHGLPYDAPEQLAAVVNAFLRSLTGP
ncbi:alpha/beta fold hydrolase [Deinococcus ruber]|uniref:Hydrolase n=1 Tax=Deinococcus ruber TaxID=1848197 RepID=A0A918CGP1_9DEIO|nr:alpha/beta hydrolase [Deinococcus ruber]GGR22161.1 hydrolase [Deinococcus ruber]